MLYELRRLRQAEAETEAAAIWHENRKPKLGFASWRGLMRRWLTSLVIRCDTRLDLDVRRAPVALFKNYGIYYFVQGAEVAIISIFNDRRDPTLLKKRREGTDPAG